MPTTTPRLAARRVWLLPSLLIVMLAAVLPTIYLAASADPQGHLRDLPVALVVETQEGTGTGTGLAARVADEVRAHTGPQIDLRPMDSTALAQAMADDEVAGAVIVPAGFDEAVASLMPGAATTAVPTVQILTNAGDGGLSGGLVVRNLTPVLTAVSQGLGEQLLGRAGADVPAANRVLLADPFDVTSAPYRALPEHSGLGTSAFYYALVLVLLAFIGASIVGPLVDGALGFLPSEVGPLVVRRPYQAVSRRRLFLARTAILVAAAPVAALLVELVAAVIGISASDPVLLWLFATTAIAAVGTAILAVFAALGPGIGSLVNTIVFVALAMVSSGGVVPTHAIPGPFGVTSSLAPFRHVVDGTRSLLYFDGSSAAGLGGAWVALAVIGLLGLLLGLLVTTAYGRVPAFTRHPQEVAR